MRKKPLKIGKVFTSKGEPVAVPKYGKYPEFDEFLAALKLQNDLMKKHLKGGQ